MANLPLISILMPVRNEESHIRSAVESVLTNGYPLDRMEVLVIDGDSDDGTVSVLQEMASTLPLRILRNAARIVPPAMNIGLAEARGEIIFRLDGHAKFLPGYLNRVVAFLAAHPEVACAGGALQTRGESPIGQAITAAQSSPFGVGNSRFRLAGFTGEVDTLAFGGYRREIFQQIGGFDEELVRNQDDEFNHRLLKAGHKIMMLGDISILYFSRGSYVKLWRQYFQYGFWKIRTMQKLGKIPTLRAVVPVLFILAMLTSMALVPWTLLPILTLAIVYGAFLLVGFFHGERQSFILRWRKSLATLILHFSYGLGECLGILKFYFKLPFIGKQTQLSR